MTSSGTIGMSRSPTMNSSGVRNAWPEHGVLGVRQVEVALDHPAQQVRGEVGVHAGRPVPGRVVGVDLGGQDDGEGGDGLQPERLEVVEADEDDGVRFRLVEDGAERAQPVGAGVELGGVLVRRTAQQLRCVDGGGRRDDVRHWCSS